MQRHDHARARELLRLYEPLWTRIFEPLVNDSRDLTSQRGKETVEMTAWILPAMVTVTGPETTVACACMGLGLIQGRDIAPTRSSPGARWSRCSPASALAVAGPCSLFVTGQLSLRLRLFIDWMAELNAGRVYSDTTRAA